MAISGYLSDNMLGEWAVQTNTDVHNVGLETLKEELDKDFPGIDFPGDDRNLIKLSAKRIARERIESESGSGGGSETPDNTPKNSGNKPVQAAGVTTDYIMYMGMAVAVGATAYAAYHFLWK